LPDGFTNIIPTMTNKTSAMDTLFRLKKLINDAVQIVAEEWHMELQAAWVIPM